MPARIQRDQREGVGWPEFAGSDLMAADGVRAEFGATLHGTARSAERLYGFLGSPGARRCNKRKCRSSGARGSPVMADGELRPWRHS